MFKFWKTTSSLPDDKRQWIDRRFAWLLENFGDEILNRPVITPTLQFFPDPYSATEKRAEALFCRICTYMHIDRSRIDLNFYQSSGADDIRRAFNPVLQNGYALGAFANSDEKVTIWIECTRLDEPESLVATMSHELGHVLLLAEGRCDASLPDHEPLTDLLTVFFGFGIFSANTVLREVNWQQGNFSGWSMSRQGYLSMEEFAYALAVYADARGEPRPNWESHLRKDLRALLKFEMNRLLSLKDNTEHSAIERLMNRVNSTADRRPTELNDKSNAANPLIHLNDDGDEVSVLNEADVESYDDTNDASTLFSEGVFHAQEGNYEAAIQAFSAFLELDSEDAEAWYQRGRSFAATRRNREAIQDYSQALAIDPKYFDAICGRAWAHGWQKQYQEALNDTKNALRIERKDAVMHYVQGVSFLGLSEFQSARKSLDAAIRSNPSVGEFYLARSRANTGLNLSREAEEDLAEAIRRTPELADTSTRKQTLAGR